ncbi:MAG: cytochrome C oxidase subunit IV family protein [Phycisphaerae bacterium]|nr:cytochrome C oxidase subunit IV family protein [Phycisphaerae bacterium]
MSHAHQPPAADAVVDLYPAGASYSHGHHGHVIVPKRVLLTVLGVLMFFTLLTVGAAQAEQWISHTFDVVIPQWVNVAVALSIATVKSIIVVMFFMQLKYDNPMNSIVVIFTLFVLAFFLGFTAIDLTSRDRIYREKMDPIVAGGTGGLPISKRDGKETALNPNESIAAFSRARVERIIDEALAAGTDITDKAAAKYQDHRMHEILELREEGKALPKELAAHADKLLQGAAALEKAGKPLPGWLHHFEKAWHENPGPGSSPDRSRVKRGVTMPGLAPAGHGEPGGHGAEPAKPAGGADHKGGA